MDLPEWMSNVELVERLRVAGAHVTDGCLGLLTSHKDDGTQLAERGASLAGAVEELQALLQELTGVPPAGVSNPAAASLRPTKGTCTTPRGSRLLQLPDDLLTSVAHTSGKGSRLLCSRLRDAYGPPSLTVRQPITGFEVELQTDHVLYGGYNMPLPQLQCAVLSHLHQRHGSKLSMDAVASCSARWPGWAARVTRLELSDTYSPDATGLRLIHEALPNLQQLELAVAPYLKPAYEEEEEEEGEEDEDYEAPAAWPFREVYRGVPKLAHVTQLSLLCSSYNLHSDPRSLYPAHFGLLQLLPSLRSLHLDLRFLRLESSNLRLMLEQLEQLEHLEVVFGPEGPIFDAGYEASISMALHSVAERLQSLVFLAPPSHLGDGALGLLLSSMTRLTQLGWCTGYGLEDERVEATHDWLLAPRVQQLVLGSCQRGSGEIMPAAMDIMARGILTSADTRPELQTLSLPLVRVADEDDVEEARLALQRMLRALGARCPGLTGLRLGWALSVLPDAGPRDGAEHWLQAAAQFQQLRQLVVTLEGHELDSLACLASLPLLGELWLRVMGGAEEVLEEQLQEDPHSNPGSGLARLTSLNHLAVCTMYTSRSMVHSLLAAVGGLPRLEVLDVTAAEALAMAASRCGTTPCTAGGAAGASALHLGAARQQGLQDAGPA